MKKLISILLCTCLVTSMAACGNSGKETPASTQAETKAPAANVTEAPETKGGDAEETAMADHIVFWTTSDGQTQDDLIVAAYEEANPEVDVEILYLSTDDLKKNLKIAASSNTLPNIWYNWGGSLGSFYPENGLTYDFTEMAKERNWGETITQAGFDMATLAGQLSGIPTKVSSFSFIYYKPIFEAAGWNEPPKTFEEFEQCLADIKANDVYPLAFAGKNGWHVMRFIELLIEMYCGPELHDQMGSLEAAWDNEGLTKAMEKFKEYVDLGYFPEGFITSEPNDQRMLLYSGIAAMSIGNNSETASIVSEGFNLDDFGTFNFPGTDNCSRVSTLPNIFQCNINNTPEELERCIDFAFYYISEKAEKAVTDGGQIYKQIGARIGQKTGDPIIADMLEQAKQHGTFTIMDQALPQEIISQWFICQDSVAGGTMKPEEVGAFMDEQIAAYKASK